MKKFFLGAMAALFLSAGSYAQNTNFLKDRKVYLNEDGSNYLKFTMLSQIWVRQQQYNPNTTVSGTPKSSGADIGIRRFRMQLYGQLTDRVFIYTQIGENNYNNISDRKLGLFVHDALGEYAVVKEKFSLGAGLTAWSGLSRFAAPSAGAILAIDAPLYQQATNDVTDQFLRKLSVYAKGKLGKVDYRVSMAQPMAIQKSNNYSPAISTESKFAPTAPKMQWNGYFQYQFWDQESNLTPYMLGTYLGKKRVLTAGVGFVYQPDAMWRTTNYSDTIKSAMTHLSADVFYEKPIGTKGEALNIYANVAHYDFGKNYIRNQAAMNPANGVSQNQYLNGSGNGFPAYGTGTILYAQAGYKFKDNLIGKTTLMPYAAIQHADYDRLKDRMNFVDVGVNWLLAGNTSKFTLSYQNRPVYDNEGYVKMHKGAFTAQYQVFFN